MKGGSAQQTNGRCATKTKQMSAAVVSDSYVVRSVGCNLVIAAQAAVLTDGRTSQVDKEVVEIGKSTGNLFKPLLSLNSSLSSGRVWLDGVVFYPSWRDGLARCG